MKFRSVAIASATGICLIGALPGIEAAWAGDALRQFCQDAELSIRAHDGFPQSGDNDRVAGQLSQQGLVAFGPPAKDLSDDDLSAVQRDHLGRELFDEYSGGFSVLEFGSKAPIFAVENVAGTAACQTLWFFRRLPNGNVEPIAKPAQPIGGCSGDFARMGRVADVPVIIDESYQDTVSKLKFVAWRGEFWEHLCSFSVTYSVGFDLVEQQCQGKMCGDFKRRVALWVEAVSGAESGRPFPVALGLTPATGVPEKELNARNFQTGLAPKAQFRAPSFLWGSPLFDAELSGKPYRVRIGRLDWGSSVSPDRYLVAIFDGKDASGLPVAGYILAARRKALASLNVE